MFDHLSDGDFRRIADVVGSHTGIRMPEAKRSMVEGRLRRRVHALGLGTVEDYCRYLFREGGIEAEFTHLIDVVTTNKTDFFREPEHFDFLRNEAVPALLGDPRRGSGGMLKVWSAAASCGAEAYTIAMVLSELSPRLRNFRFAVLGTDICTEVLEQAAAAVYPEEMMAPVPAELRRRYVMRARDPKRAEVRIVPELRHRVHFRRLNLIDASYPVDRDVDVVFCRNILIYFDRPTQRAVVERLCGHLRPGGFLLLGHSESMAGADLPLTQVAPTIFRRR
ncbi:CheR family methyltransferase [Azospirillum sp. TSO22-1]|uniref:CheR family methyltransferase n=1 Tax=Azospirillum sp. TSO22-1 TaxID=716789 RepID=UPI001FFEEA94|nr:CheR family methyltransferase [Azospirillum sp. TSO22-1]